MLQNSVEEKNKGGEVWAISLLRWQMEWNVVLAKQIHEFYERKNPEIHIVKLF